MQKRKVLVWADSPTVATGFAQVSRNILKELHKTGKYEFDMVGINFSGEFDRSQFDKEYPFISRIVPAIQQGSPDLYGREFLVKVLTGYHKMLQPPYDLFFSIQDHFIIQQKDTLSDKGLGQAIKAIQKNTLSIPEYRENHFLWVGYFPVDGQLKAPWVEEAIATCDYPVAYCEYGAGQMLKFDSPTLKLKDRLKTIYHGTNTTDFFPATAKEKALWRTELLGDKATKDTFILMNVARNQPRKDMFKTLLVFKEWIKLHPDSLLYLHCDPNDLSGGNLFDMARFIDLPINKLLFARGFQAHSGVPIDQLNKLYNIADALITTSLGEGWGLPITEAMACKLPVYAPAHTAITDILGFKEGALRETMRGIAFAAGSTPTEWTNAGRQDNEIPRPITNVDSAVEALQWGHSHKKEVNDIVERAYQWTQDHTWEIECQKWEAIFDEACLVNDQLRSGVGVAATKKLSPNDICPLCGDKKIKKCAKHRSLYLG